MQVMLKTGIFPLETYNYNLKSETKYLMYIYFQNIIKIILARVTWNQQEI